MSGHGMATFLLIGSGIATLAASMGGSASKGGVAALVAITALRVVLALCLAALAIYTWSIS